MFRTMQRILSTITYICITYFPLVTWGETMGFRVVQPYRIESELVLCNDDDPNYIFQVSLCDGKNAITQDSSPIEVRIHKQGNVLPTEYCTSFLPLNGQCDKPTTLCRFIMANLCRMNGSNCTIEAAPGIDPSTFPNFGLKFIIHRQCHQNDVTSSSTTTSHLLTNSVSVGTQTSSPNQEDSESPSTTEGYYDTTTVQPDVRKVNRTYNPNKNLVIIVIACLGSLVIIAAAVVVLIIFVRRKKKLQEKDLYYASNRWIVSDGTTHHSGSYEAVDIPGTSPALKRRVSDNPYTEIPEHAVTSQTKVDHNTDNCYTTATFAVAVKGSGRAFSRENKDISTSGGEVRHTTAEGGDVYALPIKLENQEEETVMVENDIYDET